MNTMGKKHCKNRLTWFGNLATLLDETPVEEFKIADHKTYETNKKKTENMNYNHEKQLKEDLKFHSIYTRILKNAKTVL